MVFYCFVFLTGLRLPWLRQRLRSVQRQRLRFVQRQSRLRFVQRQRLRAFLLSIRPELADNSLLQKRKLECVLPPRENVQTIIARDLAVNTIIMLWG